MAAFARVLPQGGKKKKKEEEDSPLERLRKKSAEPALRRKKIGKAPSSW